MRRWRALALGAGTVAMALVIASAASGDPYPLCNGLPACKTGWYTSPVTVTWDLNGGSNLAGCASQYYAQDTNQSGLENEITSQLPPWTYCTASVSQGSATILYFIHVEISSPVATAIASGAPNSSGWFNQPLTIGFKGSSFSGIAFCTSTTYSGPDSANAMVAGSCTDNAGKRATASFSFPYDATPPSLSVGADPGAENVSLNWSTSGDLAPLASVSVLRTPGIGSASPSTVYSGTAESYEDTHVKDGVQYTYTITARDQAGNTTVRTIKVTPEPRLLAPALRALLTTPPMLSWTPIRGATYYNVQLYRDGKMLQARPTRAQPQRKVLSAWPTGAQLQLSPTWRYKGHRYRLRPGRYRWYVWPGFGRRAADHYGHVIGKGAFVVSKTAAPAPD